MTGLPVIDSFEGKYKFLSNFYEHQVYYDGEYWPSVEHAYQAAKTLGTRRRREILLASTPGQAKRLGRRAPIRLYWDYMRVLVMYELLSQKFHPATFLAADLVATKDAQLVEGNTWHDQFWGDCRCSAHIDEPGLNWLGGLLMIKREELYDEIRI